MKILLTVYKDTGKYYTSESVETDIDPIKQHEAFLELIKEKCPARLTNGVMTVMNQDEDGTFVNRMYPLNQLLDNSKPIKSVLAMLLKDLTDAPDLCPNSSDEDFISITCQYLAEKNSSVCPFKNYELQTMCPSKDKCGTSELEIDCIKNADWFGPEHINVWEDFINATCE